MRWLDVRSSFISSCFQAGQLATTTPLSFDELNVKPQSHNGQYSGLTTATEVCLAYSTILAVTSLFVLFSITIAKKLKLKITLSIGVRVDLKE